LEGEKKIILIPDNPLDLGFYDKVLIPIDSFKINPTYNTDGAMKSNCPGLTKVNNILLL
jgi:hypothetical protein